MKKGCTIVLMGFLWLFGSEIMYSQGFDWIYDSRMPSKYPSVFMGLHAETGMSFISMDQLQSKQTPLCGNYENGKASDFKAGLNIEVWNQSGLSSLCFGLGVQQISMSFDDESQFTRWEGEEVLYTYRFGLESKSTYIFAEGFFKHRFSSTHFHGAIGLTALFGVGGNTRQYGEILEPADKVSTEEFGEAKDLSLKTVNLMPIVRLGYDLDMGRNLYSTPYIAIGFPVFSSINDVNVRNWQINLGLSIQYAMPWYGWQ